MMLTKSDREWLAKLKVSVPDDPQEGAEPRRACAGVSRAFAPAGALLCADMPPPRADVRTRPVASAMKGAALGALVAVSLVVLISAVD